MQGREKLETVTFDGLISKLEKVGDEYPKETKGFFSFFTLRPHHNQRHADDLKQIGNAITQDIDAEKLKEAELLLKLHDILSKVKSSTMLLTGIRNALVLYPPFQTLGDRLSSKTDGETEEQYLAKLTNEVQVIDKDTLCKLFVEMADLRGVRYKTEVLVSEAKKAK